MIIQYNEFNIIFVVFLAIDDKTPHQNQGKQISFSSLPRGGGVPYFHQNRTWMCLLNVENLTFFYINFFFIFAIFPLISYPLIYHFWK